MVLFNRGELWDVKLQRGRKSKEGGTWNIWRQRRDGDKTWWLKLSLAEGAFRHVLAGHVTVGYDVTITLHWAVIRSGVR